MIWIKKMLLFTCIILIILSLYNDFTKEFNNDKSKHDLEITDDFMQNDIHVVKIKINPGDTVLSVSEKINGNHLSTIGIDKIMEDFFTVNPSVHTSKLSPGTPYYFPIYDK